MKVSVEKLPNSEAVLEVDLTWDELEKASDKAYRKLVQKVDVQGFRRGKAPRSLLERKLGKEHIYQEGLDELISETYRNAIKEHELTPIKPPDIDAPIFEIGQPYHFSLRVPILTPVVLGDYSSLHFEREEVSVTSEEVEQEVELLRTRQATWQEVERSAALGDRVTVDLKLTVEEQIISDLKDNPFELTHERHGLFTGIDEQIVGMQPGESKKFTTTLPTDYSNEKLAGKEANFAVTLHKVELKEIPELDDTLASRFSNGEYETLEELRKVISDSMYANKKNRAREELREKVVNAVIEHSEVIIHPSLIEDEAEEMVRQLSHLLERQHMSVDQYLKLVRKTRQEYLKEIEPEAEKRVKRQLILDEIAIKEKITVEPDELAHVFEAYAKAGQQLARTEEQIRSVAFSYRREKVISRLIELTTDPDPDAQEASALSTELEAETLANDSDTEDAETEIVATEEAASIESEKALEP